MDKIRGRSRREGTRVARAAEDGGYFPTCELRGRPLCRRQSVDQVATSAEAKQAISSWPYLFPPASGWGPIAPRASGMFPAGRRTSLMEIVRAWTIPRAIVGYKGKA